MSLYLLLGEVKSKLGGGFNGAFCHERRDLDRFLLDQSAMVLLGDDVNCRHKVVFNWLLHLDNRRGRGKRLVTFWEHLDAGSVDDRLNRGLLFPRVEIDEI